MFEAPKWAFEKLCEFSLLRAASKAHLTEFCQLRKSISGPALAMEACSVEVCLQISALCNKQAFKKLLYKIKDGSDKVMIR